MTKHTHVYFYYVCLQHVSNTDTQLYSTSSIVVVLVSDKYVFCVAQLPSSVQTYSTVQLHYLTRQPLRFKEDFERVSIVLVFIHAGSRPIAY